MEHNFTQTRNTMRVNGMQINAVDGGACIMLMAPHMRESGLMMGEVAKECSD
jgi:hypothetical protein